MNNILKQIEGMKGDLSPQDLSALEARQMQVAQMQPEQQMAELMDIANDFSSRIKQAQGRSEFGEELMMAPGAQGAIAGPSSNPYTAYVAAGPLEHLASGLRTYQGVKERREARTEMKEMEDRRQAMLAKIMRANLPQGNAPGGGAQAGGFSGMPGRRY